MLKLHFIRLLAALALAAAPTTAFAELNLLAAAMDSITADELYEHIEVLADDVYEGREAGTRGGRAAAQYLLQQLKPYGLAPAGDNDDYIQTFNGGWRNILLMQPGYDPDLQQEIIVLGAHYDHVGYGNRSNSNGPVGYIHNGADDNASGAAVLLETIEAFATSGLRTRRSILFAFWDGEEKGLVGSRHWLARPTLPADRVKLAITVDMVGRLREGQLYVYGTRSGYGLRRLVSGPVEVPLWLDFTWELDENSDHWSFLERRMPIVLLHTGLHRDYHRPSDDVEKVNRDGLREVGRYLLAMLIKVADEDRLPEFRRRATRESESMRRSLERPLEPLSLHRWPSHLPRPRLGMSWRDDDAEPGSVFLTRIIEHSPAAHAGLAVHDRIYELNGHPFPNAAEFEASINALLDTNPPTFTLLIERRGHLHTITIAMPSESQEPRVQSPEPTTDSERQKAEMQESLNPNPEPSLFH